MTQYNIELSQAQDLALSSIAVSQDEWIQNVVHERCRLAIEDIVKVCVEKCLENNVQIPSSKDEMVLLSFERGWIKSALERNAEVLATIQAQTPTE